MLENCIMRSAPLVYMDELIEPLVTLIICLFVFRDYFSSFNFADLSRDAFLLNGMTFAPMTT